MAVARTSSVKTCPHSLKALLLVMMMDPYLCGSVSSTLAVPSIPADGCQIRAGAAA